MINQTDWVLKLFESDEVLEYPTYIKAVVEWCKSWKSWWLQAAGAGKTTFLVTEALKIHDKKEGNYNIYWWKCSWN